MLIIFDRDHVFEENGYLGQAYAEIESIMSENGIQSYRSIICREYVLSLIVFGLRPNMHLFGKLIADHMLSGWLVILRRFSPVSAPMNESYRRKWFCLNDILIRIFTSLKYHSFSFQWWKEKVHTILECDETTGGKNCRTETTNQRQCKFTQSML